MQLLLLQIVFQNLISNAVKYTPKGGTVGIEISCARNQLCIYVRDTGYGIPKSQQSKIFTKLFRADNIKSKVTDGNGLGLYIVKSIISHSGGTIVFESEEILLRVVANLKMKEIYPRRYFYPSLETLPYIKGKKRKKIHNSRC